MYASGSRSAYPDDLLKQAMEPAEALVLVPVAEVPATEPVNAQVLQHILQQGCSAENIYFYITGDNGLDYFWIIPNGNNIWNIGIWFQKMPKDAVSQFWLYKENFVDPLFSKTEFIRKLKGAYCGNYSLFNQFPHGCYTT